MTRTIDTATRPKGVLLSDSKAVAEGLDRYVACAFAPDDIVEVRRLPSTRSTFHKAADLPALASELLKDNRDGENIYLGINPRKRVSGTTAEDVLLARCLVADFDNVTPDEVRRRWKEAGLPPATLAVNSGHGVHVYLRLKEPIADLMLWARLQKALAAKVGSDPVICDPPRIMRLPGFINHNPPAARSALISSCPERLYDLAGLPAWLSGASTADDLGRPGGRGGPAHTPAVAQNGPPRLDDKFKRASAYLARCDPCISGQGGSPHAYKIACKLVHGFHLSQDEAYFLIMSEGYNGRCVPPWSEKEWRHHLKNAAEKGQCQDMLNQPLAGASALPAEQTGGTLPMIKPKPRPVLLPCDPGLESKPVDYLIPNILARGMLSIIYGERDCNKSTLALCYAVQLAKEGKHVTILSAEDDWEASLLPRLRGMGANFDFLTVLSGVVKKGEHEDLFELSSDGIAALGQNIREHKTQAVVFDPIFSVLPNETNADRQTHVRKLLFRLKQFAEAEGVAILGIAHPNKDASQSPRDRLSGSGSWTDAPRFVYLMMRDPDDRDSQNRYLVANKANHLKDEEKRALLYKVKSIPALKRDGSQLFGLDNTPLTVPTLEFVQVTAETFDSLTDPDRQQKKEAHVAREAKQVRQAKLFLWGALAWGPKPAQEILAHAEAAGIAKATLARAKKVLAVIATPPSNDNGKQWWCSLPPGTLSL